MAYPDFTSVKNIAWFAGILEGEGCFLFTDHLRIQLAMTDLDTIDKIRILTKYTNKINESKQKENYKIQYRISWSGKQAAEWMMTIYPLMSIRRKAKIRECLTKWKAQEGSEKSGFINCVTHNLARNLAKVKGITVAEAKLIIAQTSGETIQ